MPYYSDSVLDFRLIIAGMLTRLRLRLHERQRFQDADCMPPIKDLEIQFDEH
jgi:hypothetical protein